MEMFLANYAYGFTLLILCIGLYGMFFKRNLVKKVIGLSIFQAAVIMFFVSLASKMGGTVPVKWDEIPVEMIDGYMNPLPHTLMLTAIVVGVATQGVAFGLLVNIWNRFKTLEEDTLNEAILEDSRD
jgi:multicomponent Na+:H+ antiporter subunit C|tara:strand:+ start:280 stop:660 length:381 start_codon:yes stop_codon:yes gene_type:complete